MTGTAADVGARPHPRGGGGAFAYLDLALLVLALPLVVLGGAPLLGFGLAAAGWLAARALGFVADRFAARSDDPLRALLVVIAALFGRLWLVVLAVIVAARLGDDQDGLTAVIVIGVAFTAYFVMAILLRPRPPRRAAVAAAREENDVSGANGGSGAR